MFIDGKDKVDQFLKRAFFAVVTYAGEESLLSQLMIFTHVPEGIFYLFSENDYAFFRPLEQKQNVSVLIYKEEEELEDICQLHVLGEACVVADLESEDARIAYECIAEKSPSIAQSYLDSKGQYVLVRLLVSSLSFISFLDIQQKLSPMYLRRIVQEGAE